MKPTVGRIVLVKSSAFLGECPAIVTAIYPCSVQQRDLRLINVRVFTNNESDLCPLLTGIGQQSDSLMGWGWRWPSYEEPTPNSDIPADPACLQCVLGRDESDVVDGYACARHEAA
jgi:hypothetical protein